MKAIFVELGSRGACPAVCHDVYADNFKYVYNHKGSNSEYKHIVTDDSIVLDHLERVLIGTGLKVTVEPGYEIQVRSRSGLVLKEGLCVANQPGTIDYSYRDELGIILINLSRESKTISLGERVAQLVINKVELDDIKEVATLPDANRSGGFGSTGKK